MYNVHDSGAIYGVELAPEDFILFLREQGLLEQWRNEIERAGDDINEFEELPAYIDADGTMNRYFKDKDCEGLRFNMCLVTGFAWIGMYPKEDMYVTETKSQFMTRVWNEIEKLDLRKYGPIGWYAYVEERL